MPRAKRVVLPDYPHHVIQRGHNKQAVFKVEGDFVQYVEDMKELKALFNVHLYAWSMTSNQVHLLVNPGTNTRTLGNFMKALSSRVTRHRNRLEKRSGTLWESRYRSSPVHPDWLFACVRHIEQVPVDFGLAQRIEDYRWSSFSIHAGRVAGAWLDECPNYHAMGATPQERRNKLIDYLKSKPTEEEWRLIHNAVQRNQLTGGTDFADQVQAMTGIRVPSRGQGRPKKKESGKGGKKK